MSHIGRLWYGSWGSMRGSSHVQSRMAGLPSGAMVWRAGHPPRYLMAAGPLSSACFEGIGLWSWVVSTDVHAPALIHAVPNCLSPRLALYPQLGL